LILFTYNLKQFSSNTFSVILTIYKKQSYMTPIATSGKNSNYITMYKSGIKLKCAYKGGVIDTVIECFYAFFIIIRSFKF